MTNEEAIQKARLKWLSVVLIYDSDLFVPYLIYVVIDGKRTPVGTGQSWEEALTQAEASA